MQANRPYIECLGLSITRNLILEPSFWCFIYLYFCRYRPVFSLNLGVKSIGLHMFLEDSSILSFSI